MVVLRDVLIAEQESVRGPASGTSNVDCEPLRRHCSYSALLNESSLITFELSNLLEFFPSTLSPVPQLRYRAARLLLAIPKPLMENYEQAISLLSLAISGYRVWYNDMDHPVMLGMRAS
jgi:hypothetical protein